MISPKYLAFLLGVAMLSLYACDQGQIEDMGLDMGYDYHPMEVGLVRRFLVDSIIYDPIPGGIARDSSRTLVMEVLADTLRDLKGQLFYRVERFERVSADSPWQIKAVYSEQENGRQLFRTEENLRQVKLVFPPIEGRAWSAHLFFSENTRQEVAGESLETFKGWAPRITAKDAAWSFRGKTYPQTVEVRFADFDTRIELRRVTERYAKGLGLVFREMFILDTQCIAACQNQSWEQKAEKGYILRQWRMD